MSQDNLYELIKSMTKSEKRYFKLVSSRHTIGEENNYIILFDYIDKLTEYNEEELRNHFKGEAFLNRFSITKKRLYNHILHSLDGYHVGNSIDGQLFKMLHGAEILYNKALYNQCRKLLVSAQKLAEKHERLNILLEISNRQKLLFENKGYANVNAEDMNLINKNDMNYINAIQQNSELWNLKSELFIHLSKSGVSRTNEESSSFSSINNRLDKFYTSSINFLNNKYLFNHTKSACFFALNEFEKCREFLYENLSLFERNESFLIEHPNNYFSVLTNAIYVNERLNDFSESNKLLAKLKALPVDYKLNLTDDFQIKLFSSTSSIELSTYIKRGEFGKAINQIPIVENGLIAYGKKITPLRRAYLNFKIAGIYLSINEYNQALKWVNAILNDQDLDQSEDIIAFTHMLDLLVHLELKHNQLLPYSIKSTHRFLKSRNKLHDFEKVILSFITKLIKEDNVFENESIWEELYEEMLLLKDDVYQGVALEYFDFESWAKSKAKRLPFEKVVQDKFVKSTERNYSSK